MRRIVHPQLVHPQRGSQNPQLGPFETRPGHPEAHTGPHDPQPGPHDPRPETPDPKQGFLAGRRRGRWLARFAGALALAGALLSAPVLASSGVTLGGRASATFGVAVDGTLPVASADLELRLHGEVGSGYFPDAIFEASLDSGYDAADGGAYARLGDAYVTLNLGDLTLSVGQKTVSWGSTDSINPVDVLSPRDLSFPLEREKLPVPLLQATYYVDDTLSVEAVVLPGFVPSVPPGERWQVKPSMTLPPGVTIVERRAPIEERPELKLENVQFGVRARFALTDWDVNVDYFHGFRSLPTFQATVVPTGTPGQVALQPHLRYDRIDVVGFDLQGVVGPVVLRGEAAYTFTADGAGTDPEVGNHSAQVVVGGEYVIPGGPRTIVQSIFDYTAPDAGEDADLNLKFMTALSYQASTRTQLQMAWMQNVDGSGAVVPKVSYSFADGVTGEAGAYVFYGATGTEFGDWSENAQLRLGLAYAF